MCVCGISVLCIMAGCITAGAGALVGTATCGRPWVNDSGITAVTDSDRVSTSIVGRTEFECEGKGEDEDIIVACGVSCAKMGKEAAIVGMISTA